MTASSTHPKHHHGAKGLWIRARFWVVAVGMGLIAAAAITALCAWLLIRSAPSWWNTVHTATPQSENVGREIENAVVNQLHAQRPPGEVWSVALTQDDANDWLSTRLVKWLQNRDNSVDWSTTIQRAAISFKPGSITLGLSIRTDRAEDGHVLTLELIPSIDEQGRLWLLASELAIGRLPLPLGMVASDSGLLRSFLPRGVDDGAGAVLTALAGKEPLAQRAAAKLGDNRTVRLTALEVRDGRIDLTCTTEPAAPR